MTFFSTPIPMTTTVTTTPYGCRTLRVDHVLSSWGAGPGANGVFRPASDNPL